MPNRPAFRPSAAARLLVLLSFASMAACGSAQVAGAGRHIRPFGIAVTPAAASVAPGASVTFTAVPDGGEAIRLPVDWRIAEGAAGGTITLVKEEMGGAASVSYTAPAAGGGPYHLVASLRRAPNVQAIVTITVAKIP